MTYTLENKQVKTRKPHVCYGCQREFESGIIMRYVKTANEDGLHSAYFCEPCDKHSESFTDEDWEVTYPGDIGYWRDGVWYPVE